jgi:Pyruvate/2-oxoacid:ferredoxin oxidoreductase delta subunit
MAVRNIVKIDEDKCNGCGLCAKACAEGAIKIVGGKAKLISEVYCDGLGACIGHCPEDAITIEQREAAEFDEEATRAHLAGETKGSMQAAFVCPGMMAQDLRKERRPDAGDAPAAPSQLGQWPVQLKLVPATAPYFDGANLLLAADCVPFAMGDFHSAMLKDHSVAVGCPKLDDAEFYVEKLADILKANEIKSLTVIHMEVPCCSGLTRIAREAIARAGTRMCFEDVTIDLRGNMVRTEIVKA